MRPHVVVALAIALYAIGAIGASLVGGGWTPLVAIGVLLGTAWAVVYTATPMVMSALVTDEGRATYFGYLTGTQQVGIGAGPVAARFLVETDLGFRGTFVAAGAGVHRGRGADGRGGIPGPGRSSAARFGGTGGCG